MDDQQFIQMFEAGVLPTEQWGHREHVKVAYLYLREFPLELAIERMRTSIQRLNAAQQTPEALDRGYHETMTQAWMHLVHFTLCEYGPADTADEFYDSHPQLWQSKVLRLFYSRDRLLSWEAKKAFANPDITNLPVPKSNLRGP
jgi:hypothetical protein